MTEFAYGFILASTIFLPVRLTLGVFTIASWDRNGFRWVMKWKRFDE
ncbi:hypothetical protein IQ24_00495 [Paracoccus sulfuroxidans]|uniref:Uncharacterized protein n=1 Tax=Paracoccus sulfuroxidans TaxID=384678 RepID=A0A562NB47_9RHOB|nr:hypothetical protein IQ24_03582 [Paracoccus sulfuroxidans]TWI38355.1 hypothetical protein IQ24_00495 [Paracoccus sulfuroxidans]